MNVRFPFFLVLFSGWLASACSVPVFRYALEFWDTDTYLLEVRLPEPVPADFREALAAFAAERPINVAVREIEGAGANAGMSLRFPPGGAVRPPILDLPATAAGLALVQDSPARAALAGKLLAGDTAVFLFLESGDAGHDRAVRERLDRILRDLEGTLELPPQPEAEEAAAEPHGAGPELAIRFSVVPVRRDDPREQVLVQTLLATEADLRELKGPMVFPVFGRGRVLYAIVDKGIRADVVADAATFLAGPCSCQVKAQNPGMDLPLAAAWDSVFAEVVYREVELPPLAAISLAPGGEDPAAPDELAGASRKESPPPPAEPRAGIRLALPFAAFGLVVLVGSLGLLLRRRRQS